MTTITQYKANDGTVWNTAEEASKRDDLIRKVHDTMLPLGDPHPDMESGKGWVQHDPETVDLTRDRLADLIREEHPTIQRTQIPGRNWSPRGINGRILDGSGGGPLSRAWNRLCRIDTAGREHSQPYFALNGPDTHQVCLNPEKPKV